MAPHIGSEFMKKTRFQYVEYMDQMKGISQPSLELPYTGKKTVIDLPTPEFCTVNACTIKEAITNRRSIRSYSDTPLSISELSFLLWCTQGVKKIIPGTATFRTVPSAGARHAFETYLLVNNVSGLTCGLYRFLACTHKLAVFDLDDGIADSISDSCLGQEMVREGAVTFIWTAVPYRMTWRYGERGYRYLLMDSGHVCQNLYLAAEAIDCGVCAIGAFDDDQINHVLALDVEEQFVIYIAALGKKID